MWSLINQTGLKPINKVVFNITNLDGDLKLDKYFGKPLDPRNPPSCPKTVKPPAGGLTEPSHHLPPLETSAHPFPLLLESLLLRCSPSVQVGGMTLCAALCVCVGVGGEFLLTHKPITNQNLSNTALNTVQHRGCTEEKTLCPLFPVLN